jgi:predicted  nucleic acid-binding Zn-ribbon protein
MKLKIKSYKKINTIMKKMYTNKPTVETEVVEFNQAEVNSEKRIEKLENTVRHLSEQLHKMASALELNSRQLRRQNTDINNVTTAVRSKFS